MTILQSLYNHQSGIFNGGASFGGLGVSLTSVLGFDGSGVAV